MGLTDLALGALEAAWAKRDPGLPSMLGDPFIEPLRNEPRFKAVAARVFA
jgi:hypothetical protein